MQELGKKFDVLLAEPPRAEIFEEKEYG